MTNGYSGIELNPVVRDQIIETDEPILHQLHHQGGCDRLGHRSQTKRSVGRGLDPFLNIGVSEAFCPDDLLVTNNHRRHSWDPEGNPNTFECFAKAVEGRIGDFRLGTRTHRKRHQGDDCHQEADCPTSKKPPAVRFCLILLPEQDICQRRTSRSG